MTIVGTRPEIIKLSRVISEFDKHTNHILVHTGQNFDYELNEVFFKELEIKKPDYFLNAAGKTPAETIGNVITDSDKVMEKEFQNGDWLIVPSEDEIIFDMPDEKKWAYINNKLGIDLNHLTGSSGFA